MKQFERFRDGMSKEQIDKMRESMGEGDVRIEKKQPEDTTSSRKVVVKKENK